MLRSACAISLLLALILLPALVWPSDSRARSVAAPVLQTFNLTVSLEWNPGKQDVAAARLPAILNASGCSAEARDTYLDDLKSGLTDASRYLYSYSRGRFALGTITIDTEGASWNTADIRILADGSYRPTAEVGGIVATPTRNISATTGVSVTFYPGAITLGRQWDGRGARCGGWSQPEAWRTLGHEWGHYALFLFDEYYEQFTLREQYCTTTGFSPLDRRRGTRAPATIAGSANSLMAYHYTTDRLWESGSATGCERTPQAQINGTSDWETIRRFYPSIGSPDVPLTSPAPDPTFVLPSIAPTEYTSAPIKAEGFSAPRGVARSYLVRGVGSSQPLRIIGQGEVLQSEPAVILGARPSLGDRAHIAFEDWNTGGRSVFPANPDTVAALNTTPGIPPAALTLTPSTWQPALRIVPLVQQLTSDTSALIGLRLRIEDCARRTKQIRVVLCPAGGLCNNQITLSVGSGGIFATDLSLPNEVSSRQSAAHGYLYLRSVDTNEEIISTYQIGGGAGSGHIGAHPPLLDGSVAIEVPQGNNLPLGRDSRVLASNALVCQAPALPAGIRSIVGNPVDIQPVLADLAVGQPWGSLVIDPPLAVRLSYNQDLLDRLGIDERSLVLLQINQQGVWQIVPTTGHSLDLDWIGGVPLALQGNGAIYALGHADARVSLPLVLR
ncbi:MAG: hypothetical protein SH847_17815 [Roseiflexaceae bacterium]|nr:hypothetical protein [Roseiflexaceae bacterium]